MMSSSSSLRDGLFPRTRRVYSEMCRSHSPRQSVVCSPHSSSLNFSSGIRSCPGRKFSYVYNNPPVIFLIAAYTFLNSRVVEMQAFLVGMLSNFEFSIPEDAKRIVRHRTFAMLPMVEGEYERGPQLPMNITALSV